MLVLEAKLSGKAEQYKALDEAIRTGQFIRNKCLKLWIDSKRQDKVNRYSLNKYCAVLAAKPEYPWVSKLNSMARQASAERAWASISRFYENCKAKKPEKKGYPKFKKFSRSVEYKTTGWKLSNDRKTITLTDGFSAGSFRLIGSRDFNFYSIEQIKRVRVVKRADGYYAQFCLNVERFEKLEPTGKATGIDVGLKAYYTDSDGNAVDNPRYLRRSEKRLKKLQRRISRRHQKGKNGEKVKQSNRYHKARTSLAKKHLQVTRQRKDHAIKLARCVVKSSDFIAYEDLKVSNMVKNRHLAKSINDAAWRQFREWVDYFGKVFGKQVLGVAPHYTSVNCSTCGAKVKKSLSIRTHICLSCGTVLDRDHNAALNILMKALSTLGHNGTYARGQNHLCHISESLFDKWTG